MTEAEEEEEIVGSEDSIDVFTGVGVIGSVAGTVSFPLKLAWVLDDDSGVTGSVACVEGQDELLEEIALAVSPGIVVARSFIPDDTYVVDQFSRLMVTAVSDADEVSLNVPVDIGSVLVAEAEPFVNPRRLLLFGADDAVVSVVLVYEEKELVTELTETSTMVPRSITTLDVTFWQVPY